MSIDPPKLLDGDEVVNIQYDTPDAIKKYGLREFYYNVESCVEACRKGIVILNDKDPKKFLKFKLKSEEFIGSHINFAEFEIVYKIETPKTEFDDAKMILAKISVPNKLDLQYVKNDNPKGILETTIEVVCGRAEQMGFERFIIDALNKEDRFEEAELYFHVDKHVGPQNQLNRFFEVRADAKEAYENMLAASEARKNARLSRDGDPDDIEPIAPKKKWWNKSV